MPNYTHHCIEAEPYSLEDSILINTITDSLLLENQTRKLFYCSSPAHCRTYFARCVYAECLTWMENKAKVGPLFLSILFLILWVSPTQSRLLNAPQGHHDAETNQTDIISSHTPAHSPLFLALARSQFTFPFKQISIDQGLSQSTAASILQDQDGFIWVGTQDGLNRFDGYHFKVYKHDPGVPTSLSNNTIRELYEDISGRLWIGTDDGLNHYDPDHDAFIQFHDKASDKSSLFSSPVVRIYQDRLSDLWVATQGSGLGKFDPLTQEFIQYTHDINDNTSLASNFVTDLVEDSRGHFWVGTQNGLDLMERTTGQFHHFLHNPQDPNSLEGNNINVLLEDSSGQIWVGLNGEGLDRFDPSNERFFHYHNQAEDLNSLSNDTVYALFQDRSGKIWVGTEQGLDQYRSETDQFTRIREATSQVDTPGSLAVQSLYQDRSGAFWVGTLGSGLLLLNLQGEQFHPISHNPGNPDTLTSNMVWSLYEDHSGQLWVGTRDGLDRFDPSSGHFYHYTHDSQDPNSLSHNWVRTILEDGQGRLWIGTIQGLNRYDPQRDRIFPVHTTSTQDDLPDLGTISISALQIDPEGALIVGSDAYGAFLLEPGSQLVKPILYNVNAIKGQDFTQVYALLQDPQGSLWIGTRYNGLIRYDMATGTREKFYYASNDPYGISSNNILSILRDSGGQLWVGTANGLNLLESDGKHFRHFDEKDGLANNFVNGILEDDQGCLWLSTNKGLTRFDPANGQFKNYDQQDGLQSNEFNSGAYFKSGDGTLYFGGVNGFNVFDPDEIDINHYIPNIAITSLTQGGENISSRGTTNRLQTIVLQWPNNYFEFEFTSLNFIEAEQNQYAYKLENFDKDWNRVDNRPYGKYTNLPGGDYLLQVKGSNNDGVWNETGSTIKIHVIPPIWEANWFRLGAIFLALAGVLAGYQLRLRGIQNQSRLLAAQVAERTEEIEKRHQIDEGFREILVRLNSDQSLQESLAFIARQTHRLAKADLVCILRLDVSSGSPDCLVSCYAGQSGEEAAAPVLEPHSELIGDLCAQMQEKFRRRDTWSSRDLAGDNAGAPETYPSSLKQARGLLAAPIYSGNELFGGLVTLYKQPKDFSLDDVQLLRSLADQAALAVGNAHLRTKAEELAVISERNRLARDLHDAVTQTIFSASLISEALPALWEKDPLEGRKLLNELRQLNRSALAEMRTLLIELRPKAVLETRLEVLFQQLAEIAQERGAVQVSVECQNGVTLPEEVHLSLYRIGQEALNNVIKHAHASHVAIDLQIEPLKADKMDESGEVRVILEIQDDGAGFAMDQIPADHFGLSNMRERAQAIGAQIEINSQPGKGTLLRTTWQGKAIIR
jgi:ligand-binding sensor domain-containing protein/signal transduction histidine kinase